MRPFVNSVESELTFLDKIFECSNSSTFGCKYNSVTTDRTKFLNSGSDPSGAERSIAMSDPITGKHLDRLCE